MNPRPISFESKRWISTVKVRGVLNCPFKPPKRSSLQTVGWPRRSRHPNSSHSVHLDLPQLHVVSYNVKENLLHFDYLPGDDRWTKLNNDQLCLHIRQSSDGVIYQSIDQCLPMQNNRVHWTISKDLPYLKLSICSKKHRHICGQEIEMKEGRAMNVRHFNPSNVFVSVRSEQSQCHGNDYRHCCHEFFSHSHSIHYNWHLLLSTKKTTFNINSSENKQMYVGNVWTLSQYAFISLLFE